ncbi:MAG: ArsR/SmtB family transcription factor [Planctomycetota bacterium]|jgi:DNA-binding transcriptional ArsR family regulator
MRSILAVTKALGDRNRLRVLTALRDNELCVCQIIELLGLAPSTVSKHMSVLWHARLVEARKDGRWMHYRLAGRDASQPVKEAIRWVLRSLAEDSEIRKDSGKLKSILKMDPEKLCKKQAKK